MFTGIKLGRTCPYCPIARRREARGGCWPIAICATAFLACSEAMRSAPRWRWSCWRRHRPDLPLDVRGGDAAVCRSRRIRRIGRVHDWLRRRHAAALGHGADAAARRWAGPCGVPSRPGDRHVGRLSPQRDAIQRRQADAGHRTEERGRRTEERGRRTEERGRRTEERGRRTEERGRRTEYGGLSGRRDVAAGSPSRPPNLRPPPSSLQSSVLRPPSSRPSSFRDYRRTVPPFGFGGI